LEKIWSILLLMSVLCLQHDIVWSIPMYIRFYHVILYLFMLTLFLAIFLCRDNLCRLWYLLWWWFSTCHWQ